MVTHVLRVRMLYKRILKLHRGLPAEGRILGDNYVKDEFRRHKGVNQNEATVFLNEWSEYCKILSKQLSSKGIVEGVGIGKDLEEEHLQNMNHQQIAQLYDLRIETDKPRVNMDDEKTI